MRCPSPAAFGVLPAALLAGAVSAAAEPSFSDMEIDRDTATAEWPFSIDRGELSCVDLGEQSFVFFSEKPRSGDLVAIANRRSVVVSTNPVNWFALYEHRALYAPFDTLEILVKRLAPYEAMGRKLCLDAKAKKEN